MIYKHIVRPLLFLLSKKDPEIAHELAIKHRNKIKSILQLLRATKIISDPRLCQEIFGLNFKNPVGLAAGFDKNGLLLDLLSPLGFGHIEIGTVLPRPQAGNPRPRIFRLLEDGALINRMGFPSLGMEEVEKNLKSLPERNFVLGINIGPNKESVVSGRLVEDYVAVLEKLYRYGDYITVNVSSPNTARLRELQGKEALGYLLDQVIISRNNLGRKPILVKIAPNLSEAELDDILEVVTAREIQGIIATNTTTSRPNWLKNPHQKETGGLSGKPLFPEAVKVVRYLHRHSLGKIPIIGVGGIFSDYEAWLMIRGGACLVQVFTGFVLDEEGPSIVNRINKGLLKIMERDGIKHISELIGVDVGVRNPKRHLA